MRILYDSKDPRFKEPFGTVRPDETCRISLHIPRSVMTHRSYLIFEREDGTGYMTFPMDISGTDADYEYYTARFSLPDPGLYFYYFRIITGHEKFLLFKYGYNDTNMEAGDKWQLSCIPADFYVPQYYAGKVMYQIFPDRFYAKGACTAEGKLTPYRIHEDKHDIPDYEPDENGEVKNCDFFGGNLAGITEKLDHIKSLGVSVIYLNPIFKAYSNHRYDTADYLKIDELLGTEEDFRELCRAAHEKDMKVILDGVFSHTGSRSRYFDAEDEFGSGAYHHPDSPYRSWYQFEEYPGKYTAWWGIKTLPCVNELDPGYLDLIIDGEDSVIAHWIRAGADGFRLDVADELPDAFILRLRRRLKMLKPDALLIGEVWEDASNKISYDVRRRYFTDGELDSVMNYPFRKAIIDYVCGRDDGTGLCRTVMEISENYPPEVLQTLMNMLSTHDTYRILTQLSPDDVPAEKSERAGYKMPESARKTAEERLCAAAFLQFVLPGMPCIYYGDEIGMEGYEDPFCRGYYEWEKAESDNTIRAYFAALAALRNAETALQKGGIKAESDGCGRVVITRKYEGEEIVAAINREETYECILPGKVLFGNRCEKNGDKAVLQRSGCVVVKR
ncbi:MAG: glycoside hydrolase family 13 protein [Lachnospiraceae bacterium]|nr:glycoside hydrolase family 13 protein [Lachnospiraceae bacterium]